MRLAAITFLVRDYDEAIAWFVDVLGFELVEDTQLSLSKRWVRVAPPNSEFSLLLAKADTPAQINAVGLAVGGRVGYFLHVENFTKTYDQLKAKGTRFRENPRHEVYGSVAVFDDLYGNGWDLIGPPKI